jgi:uncharacterized protein DUF6952
MRLPIIKHLLQFIEDKDEDFLSETIETLEALTELDTLKDEEMDVIGELISNIHGALEVKKLMDEGETKTRALNKFMERVVGSIDR